MPSRRESLAAGTGPTGAIERQNNRTLGRIMTLLGDTLEGTIQATGSVGKGALYFGGRAASASALQIPKLADGAIRGILQFPYSSDKSRRKGA